MGRPSKLEDYIEKLRKYYFKYGFIPNYDTLMVIFGLNSKGSVFKIFNQLVELGFIKKDGKKIYPTNKLTSIPMFESVRAGFPSPARESNKYDIDIQSYLIDNPNSTIFLKVNGDSMIMAGIYEDDIVIVDKSIKPKIGNIVIAIVDGDYTMKYLMKDEHGKFYLKAANEKYQDIKPHEELQIFGVVTGTFRKIIN